MGATLSYLGYASHQQPYSRSHEHVSQQLPPDLGLDPILGNEDSIINLCARLAALEKDLQVSRTENKNKESVIQYLLQSSASNARLKEVAIKLKEQFLDLKLTIDRTKKENEEIKAKLEKAEANIFALSTAGIPSSGPQSTSTSFNNCSDSPPKSEELTEDLIDLLGCSQESDNAKLMEEETTLLDDLLGDESDIEELYNNSTPEQSLHQSFDSDFEGSKYIVHFANSDDAKPLEAVNNVRVPCYSSDFVTTPQQQNNIPAVSKESADSSSEHTSSPSGPNSTATSFSSTGSGMSPLMKVHTNWLDESFSQLKALDSEGCDLDKSIAIVSTLADKLTSLGTANQAESSRPTAQAPIEAQDLQPSAEETGPRWSREQIFESAQDREIAVTNNRRSAQAGTREVSYPDFFKHGIRFVPKNYEQDVYRTVAISGLPPSVSMKVLLEKVRGGLLVDAKLLDMAKITGSKTALVTFLHEYSAMAYEDHAKEHPIAFNNVVAQVAVVPTPTWPIPVNLRTGIEEFGCTRCFEVHNIPRKLFLPTIRQELTTSPVMKSDSLECMRLGTDGVLGLRFSSIRAAGQSSALFSKTLRYRGCSVKYFPDPCAQPLETLLEQQKVAGKT